MKRYFAAALFALTALLVYPQSQNQNLRLIAALQTAAVEKDDAKRLALFDAIVQSFGIVAEPSQTASADPRDSSKWVFDQEIDPLTDKRQYYFLLEADSWKNEYGNVPVLVVRFNGEETEIYINWKTYLGNDTDDYKNEAKYITTRIDADQPSTELWSNSTDGKALFCPWTNVPDLVQHMGDGTKFAVRCTPYDASLITAIFDIRGLKAISMLYNDSLGWWK